MHVILIATRLFPDLDDSAGANWLSLPPLVDRPFVQRVLESVVQAGGQHIHLLANDSTGQLRQLVEDGRRWGVTVHHVDAEENPYRVLSSFRMHGAVLLGHADTLPELPLIPCPTDEGQVLLYGVRPDSSVNSRWEWSGWAHIPAVQVSALREAATSKEALALLSSGALGRPEWVSVPQPLSSSSYESLLESHSRVLSGDMERLLLTGRERSPGIRLGRNVRVHPTARLIAPVFIGENSRIEEHVSLGPSVSVGKDCLINRRATLSQAVVCSGTYVGEGVAIERSIAECNRLVNVGLGVEIEEIDEALLCSVYGSLAGEWFASLLNRVMAAIVLFCCLPLFLVFWFIAALRTNVQRSTVLVVRAPAASSPERWQTLNIPQWASGVEPGADQLQLTDSFIRGFIPALPLVIKGDLDLAGRRPLTRDALLRLEPAERSLYLRSRLGLFSPREFETGLFSRGTAAAVGRQLLFCYLAGSILSLRLRTSRMSG